MTVHNSFIHNSQKWKHPRCPSANEWVNTASCIPAMDGRLAIKGSAVLIHTTKWPNFEMLRQVKETRHKSPHIVNRQIHQDGRWVSGCQEQIWNFLFRVMKM